MRLGRKSPSQIVLPYMQSCLVRNFKDLEARIQNDVRSDVKFQESKENGEVSAIDLHLWDLGFDSSQDRPLTVTPLLCRTRGRG